MLVTHTKTLPFRRAGMDVTNQCHSGEGHAGLGSSKHGCDRESREVMTEDGV